MQAIYAARRERLRRAMRARGLDACWSARRPTVFIFQVLNCTIRSAMKARAD